MSESRRLGRHQTHDVQRPPLLTTYARQWGHQELMAWTSEWDGPYLTSDTLGDSVGHAGMPGLLAWSGRNCWPAGWPALAEDDVLDRYRQITEVVDTCGMPTELTPVEAGQLAELGLVQAGTSWDHQYRPGYTGTDLQQLATALLRNLAGDDLDG